MSERDYFLKARNEFDAKHEFVTRIFGAVGRLNAEPRRNGPTSCSFAWQ
jgi:hypothetical protein